MFGRGRYGSKFGLVRSPAEATAFSSRVEAGTKAGRAGNVIMREFNTVELDAIPAATTRPHIGVRITAWIWTIVEALGSGLVGFLIGDLIIRVARG
jgi:hypothetical protein